MRERNWNRRHRKRRARYTRVPETVPAQHVGVSEDGAAHNLLDTRDVRANARLRELRNLGPLEQRADRKRAALTEATEA